MKAKGGGGRAASVTRGSRDRNKEARKCFIECALPHSMRFNGEGQINLGLTFQPVRISGGVVLGNDYRYYLPKPKDA